MQKYTIITTKKQLKLINKITNTSFRTIYKLSKKSHTSEFLKNMKCLHFKEISK